MFYLLRRPAAVCWLMTDIAEPAFRHWHCVWERCFVQRTARNVQGTAACGTCTVGYETGPVVLNKAYALANNSSYLPHQAQGRQQRGGAAARAAGGGARVAGGAGPGAAGAGGPAGRVHHDRRLLGPALRRGDRHCLPPARAGAPRDDAWATRRTMSHVVRTERHSVFALHSPSRGSLCLGAGVQLGMRGSNSWRQYSVDLIVLGFPGF